MEKKKERGKERGREREKKKGKVELALASVYYLRDPGSNLGNDRNYF
jgi:hypothetical protein